MKRRIITPELLEKLPVIAVDYALQNMRTSAIQVNPETIGAMAIEFGVEIQTAHPNIKWLPTVFQRSKEKGEKTVIERTVYCGDWLVIIDDEVHVFPHDVFWNTFGQAKIALHGEQDDQIIGIVTRTELREDELAVEGKIYQNPGTTSGFMDLPVGLTNEGKELLQNEQHFQLNN